ncbi:MAG: hypothetical protein HC908_16860 [Calothrix sp. SM1_7_51]|nr:hypothetical protein [Calothrix sp. SM1_7_51]
MSNHSIDSQKIESKKNNSEQSVFSSTPCPVCNLQGLNILPTQNSIHYAQYRCSGCDRFRGWQEKPSTVRKREQIREMILNLLDSPGLSDWGERFS